MQEIDKGPRHHQLQYCLSESYCNRELGVETRRLLNCGHGQPESAEERHAGHRALSR